MTSPMSALCLILRDKSRKTDSRSYFAQVVNCVFIDKSAKVTQIVSLQVPKVEWNTVHMAVANPSLAFGCARDRLRRQTFGRQEVPGPFSRNADRTV